VYLLGTCYTTLLHATPCMFARLFRTPHGRGFMTMTPLLVLPSHSHLPSLPSSFCHYVERAQLDTVPRYHVRAPPLALPVQLGGTYRDGQPVAPYYSALLLRSRP